MKNPRIQTRVKGLTIAITILVPLLSFNGRAYAQDETKLIGPGADWEDQCGWSVSIEIVGDPVDLAIVGAPTDDDEGENSGSAYVYLRLVEDWLLWNKLTADDAGVGDSFGSSVDIWRSNNDEYWAIVGAHNDDDAGENSGSAYIFKVDEACECWIQEVKLTASDARAGDLFGFSVSIDGDRAIVGAPRLGEPPRPGKAYIFKRNGTTWSEEARLTIGQAGDDFGWSVSIDGDRAIVGAPGVILPEPLPPYPIGAACVYKRDGATWSTEACLLDNEPQAYDSFGWAVCISNDRAIVGVPNDKDYAYDAGSASIFMRDGSTWNHETQLVGNDTESFDMFGYSVCISGDLAIVGAPHSDDVGVSSGSAYVFKLTEDIWNQEAKLTASDAAERDWFGWSVSIGAELYHWGGGGKAIVGAPLHDEGVWWESGAAYVYQLTIPRMEVTSPNGGEVWDMGSCQNIQWFSTGEASHFVNIGLSTDGGSTWAPIFTNVDNDALERWKVSCTPSTDCLIRITESDGTPSDVSDEPFTINTAAISFIVTHTNDFGPGSLREAILNANCVPGKNTIAFDIPDSGPHTIQPEFDPLPAITDAVVIDGYTQPGASPNTNPRELGNNAVLMIELDGSEAEAGEPGLRITAGNSIIRGLVINRFDGHGIYVDDHGGNVIEGNYIGTDIGGTVDLGNAGVGIFVRDASPNKIGGPSAGAANIISGNDLGGVQIKGSGSTQNYVGGNCIGTDVNGTTALGNSRCGVLIRDGATDNTIGGGGGHANIISGNEGVGVVIVDDGSTGNRILSNMIFSNSDLGIDLGGDGVTPNDDGDLDTGPNNLQNFPVLSAAVLAPTGTIIEGKLFTSANTEFRVEFFSNSTCDPSGYGEGESYLGSITITTDDDGGGKGDTGFMFTATDPVGRFISATATDPNGNTSEFSQCIETCTDCDGDGIVGNVDPAPRTFSNDFSDVDLGGGTTGRITDRGDQILTISDSTEPAPDDGVLIHGNLSGGDVAATIDGCGGTEIRTLLPGEEVYLTCGSSRVYVAEGSVDLRCEANDGRVGEAALSAGNALVFDPDAFTFTAPATNPDTVFVVIEGEEHPVAPDETLDVTPPEITIELNRDVLWPPNHKMADIMATVTVEDNVCENPTVRMDTIFSDEPDNGQGDGNTVNDIQEADFGALDTHFRLRSERSGQGDGRVYTIIYRAVDAAGNEATEMAYVRVPHDQSGHALSSMGFAPSGMELDPALRQFALVIPSSDGFDATALDVTKTYVGNVKGVVAPERSLEVDNDQDELPDLVVFYPARALSVLGDAGSIGLHYTSADGVDHLVPNIFSLGEPVPVVPSVELSRTDESEDEEQSEEDANEIPSVTTLLPSYPNPFNPSTTIPFNLVTQERVTLRIYNAQGALVRRLKDETFPTGLHRVVWDGRDNIGQSVATGVYFVRFVAGDLEMTRKVVLIR